MSQLEVDKIIPQSGTTLTLGDTGDTINFGSGVLPNFENLTVTGDFTVDTNSLKVDSTNNRVGIGTASPSVALDVVGAITASGNITGTLATASQPNITSVGTLTSFTSTGIDDNATSTAITIDSSNRVSIRNTSTTRDFHVGDSSGATTMEIESANNSSGTIFFGDAQSGASGRILYDHTSNFLRLDTNGSEAMRIDSSGKVLVGDTSVTDASASALTYSKTGYGIITNNNENAGGIKLSSSSTNALIFQADPNNQRASTEMYFYTDGSERMKIDTSYNLLVGDSSVTDASNGAKVYSKTGFGIITTNNENAGGVRLISSAQNSVLVHSDPNNERADSHIKFNVDGSQAMHIDDSLKVSIGNETVPLGKLHVKSGDSGVTSSPAFADGLFIENSTNTGLTIATPNGGVGSIVFGDVADNDIGKFQYSHADNAMLFTTSTAERMRIDSSGNVGIGTTSPDSILDLTSTPNNNIIHFNATTGGSNGDIIGGFEVNNTGGIIGKLTVNRETTSSSGYMAFQTGTSEKMRIQNNGFVGIGLTNPDANLHISGSSSTLRFTDEANSQSWQWQAANDRFEIRDVTQAVERFTILPSGNIGIGTTSPDAPLTVKEVSNVAIHVLKSNDTSILKIGEDGGGSAVYNATSGGQHIFQDTGTERMRIDSSGNVGIGASTIDNTASGRTVLQLENSSQNLLNFYVSGTRSAYFFSSLSLTSLGAVSNVPLAFIQNNTERMRIDSSGNVGIGTTSPTNALTVSGDINSNKLQLASNAGSHTRLLLIKDTGNAGPNRNFIEFHNVSGSTAGRIEHNGSTTVSYITSSDYRLKENVSYDFDATTRLKQLKPARFNFIEEPNTTIDGFLAHEVSDIVPEAISGEKDELQVWKEGEELPEGVSVGDNKLDENGNIIMQIQGIDQSKLVPLLVKTIQELEARITTLENA